MNVLLSEGHSAGGVVCHVPEHRFLMMAEPRNAVATARRALAMMDAGDLEVLAAGHRPLLPVVPRGIVGGAAQLPQGRDAAGRPTVRAA